MGTPMFVSFHPPYYGGLTTSFGRLEVGQSVCGGREEFAGARASGSVDSCPARNGRSGIHPQVYVARNLSLTDASDIPKAGLDSAQASTLQIATVPWLVLSAKDIGNLTALGMSRDLQSRLSSATNAKKSSQCFLVTCVVSSSHSAFAPWKSCLGHSTCRSGYPVAHNTRRSRACRFLMDVARFTLHIDDRMSSPSHLSRHL